MLEIKTTENNMFAALVSLYTGGFKLDELLNNPQIAYDWLKTANFTQNAMQQALNWLEELDVQLRSFVAMPSSKSFRIPEGHSEAFLREEYHGYLLKMMVAGIVDAQTREIVIHQAALLEPHTLQLGYFQTIILLVLGYQPEKKIELMRAAAQFLPEALPFQLAC